MNVSEARRTRHLVLRLDRGDELPQALVRALDALEARAGWIEGHGALEAAEIALHDGKPPGRARRVEGLVDVVQIGGSVALQDGVLTPRLTATLARETELGLQVFAGQVIWARAFAVELHVTVFDDLGLARVRDDLTGLPLLVGRSPGAPPEPSRAPIVTPPPDPPRASPAPAAIEAPPMPVRPARQQEEHEAYPEVGDAVTHFHFGECTILSSDGDRIRLRQDKDGRVREVALSMLKIEAPTTLPDGKRHFKLQRKN
jgi:predicted DNA-binding protein with PD1-like motif